MTSKQDLRKYATDRRDQCHNHAQAADYACAAAQLAAPPLAALIARVKIFSGYLPIGSEFDPRPAMTHLCGLGLTGAIPVVVNPSAALNMRQLEFQRWSPDTPVAPAVFAVPVPDPPTDIMVPELLLMPLLAVDHAGWRLGYGGGFYDRALRRLRDAARPAATPVVAVGICYAGQIVDAVPHDDNDEPLDWIVTEREIVKCGG